MTDTAAAPRPNIVLLIADDLGFSDVGCFGGEINTPNLDKLAKAGTRFTNFHTAAACSPTRSMIMSGTDNHLVGLGGMIEKWGEPGGREKYEGKPGHEGYLLSNIATLPEVLNDAGYHTILTGKWHLGNNPQQTPRARGFARDWSFMWGCHNHYAWEPQFQPDNQDDTNLGNWTKGLYTKIDMYTENGRYIDQKPNFPKQEGGFYSSDTFTDKLLGFLDEHHSDPSLKSKPFFAYHAFTAPHWPLQAPKEYRDKYKGRYEAGPAALREERLGRLKNLGLVPQDVQPHPVENPMAIHDWEAMTPDEKQHSARAMETYAAMVELIDVNVGRVVEHLTKLGELDNTLVIFMSDNGAEGGALEMTPLIGPSITRVLKRWYDNSLDNVGEPNSFVWYGPFWAQAATAPGRLFKMASSQGGIRVPFLCHWPTSISPRFTPDGIVHEFGTCMDLMPTFLELAGGHHPSSDGQKTVYKGREVLPMTGQSWGPWLRGQSEAIHSEGISFGWELHGRAAYREGNWKILFMPPPYGKGSWELYDVKADQGETNDLSEEHPEKVKVLLEGWDEYVISKRVLWGLKGDPDYSSHPTWEGEAIGGEIEDPKGWMQVGKAG